MLNQKTRDELNSMYRWFDWEYHHKDDIKPYCTEDVYPKYQKQWDEWERLCQYAAYRYIEEHDPDNALLIDLEKELNN